LRRHDPVEAILIIAGRWSRLNLGVIGTDGCTPCGRRTSAGQNEGCERHLTNFSCCLDEPAPARLLPAVDQALEVAGDAAKDAAEDAGTVAAAVLRCR
jgi:hypothetical protein